MTNDGQHTMKIIIDEFDSIDDLLSKQRRGKFLNHEEKQIIQKYADARRKENLNKKK